MKALTVSLFPLVCVSLGACDHLPDVLWYAPFFSGGGYCSEATSFVRALVLGGVDVTIFQHGDGYNHEYVAGLPDETSKELGRLQRRRYSSIMKQTTDVVAVCHSEPGAWHPPRWPTTRCPPGGTLKVGRTMFETDRLPDGWHEKLNTMDQVWVPTEFARGVFEAGGVVPSKLRVLGEPVDTEFFDPSRFQARRRGGAAPARAEARAGAAAAAIPGADSPTTTVFLSVFKWEERKGWDVLLRAYLSEFTGPRDTQRPRSTGSEGLGKKKSQPGDEDDDAGAHEEEEDEVVLAILTNAYHSSSDFEAQVDRFIATDDYLAERLAQANVAAERKASGRPLPKVVFLDRVDQHRLPAVYAAADAFVLPSRGEGWGRPHVEAMAMGLPVAATNWSGPTEYLSERNGFPLAVDGLVPVATGAFKGHLWADPSVGHLRDTLRFIHEYPEVAAERGRQARTDMVAHYSPAILGERVKELLWELSGTAKKAAAGKGFEL